MDYDHYFKLIKQNKLKEATNYKSSFIPNILYRYYWLDENEENNKKRFNTLEEGKVFLSNIKGFNDPFEGHAFIFDEKELIDNGWNPKMFYDFIDTVNSNAGICCFCNANDKEQNMPMCAYYANNHSGFCVEYTIDEKIKKFMYEVSYENKRVVGNYTVASIANKVSDFLEKGIIEEKDKGELNYFNHLAYLSLICKHKSWAHEKEIRALVPKIYGKYLEIKPSKIYIGMNCKGEHKEKLIIIAKKFQPGCEVYQMKGVENSTKHYLKEERINIENKENI